MLRAALCAALIGVCSSCVFSRPSRFGHTQRQVFNTSRRPRPVFNMPRRRVFNLSRSRRTSFSPRSRRKIRLEKSPVSSKPLMPKKRRVAPQQTAAASVLKKAIRAYRTLRWEKASDFFRKAFSHGGLSRLEKWKAWTFLGAIAYQSGKAKEAARCFLNAHKAYPHKSTSIRLFPPQMVEFYGEVTRRGKGREHN